MKPSLLSLLAKENSWDFGTSPEGVWLASPNKQSANLIADVFFEDLTVTAAKLCGKVQIFWGDRTQKPIEINHWMYQQTQKMTTQLLLPTGVQIAQMRLSLPLVRTLFEFAENPEMLAGFVRLSDERQVCMTEAIAQIVTASGQDLEEVVTRRREEYWHPADLIEFNREWQQVLEPDNVQSTLEYTYRAKVTPTSNQWRRWTTRFRLVQDDVGTAYHVGYAIATDPIPMP